MPHAGQYDMLISSEVAPAYMLCAYKDCFERGLPTDAETIAGLFDQNAILCSDTEVYMGHESIERHHLRLFSLRGVDRTTKLKFESCTLNGSATTVTGAGVEERDYIIAKEERLFVYEMLLNLEMITGAEGIRQWRIQQLIIDTLSITLTVYGFQGKGDAPYY